MLATPQLPHLEGIDGLVIPGGESTTMGHLAERLGLLEPLRAFVAGGGPVMGTCAGLIFLANTVDGQKKGGQRLVGGMDLTVCRNFFGSQIDSFETQLETTLAPGRKVPAVFIRAPAILATGPNVQVLASVRLDTDKDSAVPKTAPVAVQDGNLLGICFHPGQITRHPPFPPDLARTCRCIVCPRLACPAPASAPPAHAPPRPACPLAPGLPAPNPPACAAPPRLSGMRPLAECTLLSQRSRPFPLCPCAVRPQN